MISVAKTTDDDEKSKDDAAANFEYNKDGLELKIKV